MAVPSSPLSKEPPVGDWERQQLKQQRRHARREFFLEYLSGFLGFSSIVTMTLFCFWQNWNLWLVPVGVVALIGIIIASYQPAGLGEGLGFGLNIVCVLMISIYGIVLGNRGDDSNASAITIKACRISHDGPDGYPILMTSQGTYTITEGKYDGVSQSSADGAASMLTPGHTYALKLYDGSNTYANITGGKEVPDDGQKCSND